MPGDPWQRDDGVGREAAVDRTGGVDADRRSADRGRAVQRELPGEQLLKRAEGRAGDRSGAEVAEHRHARRGQVVPARLSSDDRLVDAAGTRLERAAEAVDHEVVADVAPTVGVHVIGPDRAQHCRHLGARVAVGIHRVMNEGHAHDAVFRAAGGGRSHPLRPRRAGDDRRLPRARIEHRVGQGERLARRRVAGRGRDDEPQDDVAHRFSGAQLEILRASRPHGVAATARACRQAIWAVTRRGRAGPAAAGDAAGSDRAEGQRRCRRRGPLNADQIEGGGSAHAVRTGVQVTQRHRKHVRAACCAAGARGPPEHARRCRCERARPGSGRQQRAPGEARNGHALIKHPTDRGRAPTSALLCEFSSLRCAALTQLFAARYPSLTQTRHSVGMLRQPHRQLVNAALRDLGMFAAAASYGPFGVFGSIVAANRESPPSRAAARRRPPSDDGYPVASITPKTRVSPV